MTANPFLTRHILALKREHHVAIAMNGASADLDLMFKTEIQHLNFGASRFRVGK